MNASALNALWNKIIAQFSTKSEMVSAVNSRQGKLIPGDGITLSGNVISCDFGAEEEVVTVVLTTSVQGASVANREILVYFNNGITPSRVLVTDENGEAVTRVPHGWVYKLAFPTIDGCEPVGDITHVSAIFQRSVEVEYVALIPVREEHVRLYVKKKDVGMVTALENVAVTVTVDGQDAEYLTDATGLVEFFVGFGKVYSVSVPAMTGYVTPAPQSFTADRSGRGINLYYRYLSSALTIVDGDGEEWTFDEFQNLVTAGTKTKADGKVVKVTTDALIDANGVFAVDKELLEFGNLKWAASNTQFNTVPLNGNSASALYYYDGKTASHNIQDEGDKRSIDTPAVDAALNQSKTLGSTPHEGFLGSTGQWSILWANRVALDDILDYLIPNGKKLSSMTYNKWTCTQNTALSAFLWSSAGSYFNKTSSYAVVPFFAF